MATVLIVDDRAINREFLAALLGYSGYQVLEAADGNEALRSIRDNCVDLVITDLMMPVMDGLELTRRLRSDPLNPSVPVIFYTATYRVEEARELARACGANLVLPKPSEPQDILDAVARTLGEHAPRSVSQIDPADAALWDEPARPGGLISLQLRLSQVFADEAGALDLPRPDGRREPSLLPVHSLSLRLAALLELDLCLGAERDVARLLQLFCRAAQDILGARHAGVIMLRAGSLEPAAWATSRSGAQQLAGTGSIDFRVGFLSHVLNSKTPISLHLSGADAHAAGLPPTDPPMCFLLGVPVNSNSGVRGVLYVADKITGARFNEEDEEFAATLGAQIALAYGNLILLAEVRLHAEQLRESEMRFRQLAENIRSVFFLVDLATDRTLYVSPSYESIWGRTCASLYADPRSWLEVVHPDDLAQVLTSDEAHARAGGFDHEYRIVLPGGVVRWIWARGFPIRDENGVVTRLAAIAEDITKRTEQERRIARLTRLRAVIGGISSAMLRIRDRDELLAEACRVAATAGVFPVAWVTAPDRTGRFAVVASHSENPDALMLVEQALRKLTIEEQRPSERAAHDGRPLIINDLQAEPTLAPIRSELMRQGYRSGAAFPLIVNGNVAAVFGFMSSERDFFDEEEVGLLSWLCADLSYALEAIEKAARLEHLAYYDALTGLSNARLFHDRLGQFVLAAHPVQGKVAVIAVDLEGFTQINDTLGRRVGDEVLRQVGARFTEALVEPFALGRIGSDTFAIASPRDPDLVATRLRECIFEALQEPFAVEGHMIRVGAQAGIALYPADAEDEVQVFKCAENALKQAKSTGEPFVYYSSEMNARIAARRALQEQLRAAVDARQFVMYYQSRVDMINGELIGAEALIRWQHPERGLVAPLEFIAMAEETGLIVRLGAWVIDTVCAQQAAWQASGLRIVPVAVNLSSVQFEKGNLLQTVGQALRTHGLGAHYLDLELTESAVMNDPATAAVTLKALREMGVGLALDDFGTGFSSLAHLKRFPFDSVKIDRSFVTDITSNPEDAAIATAIIAMAHTLKLKVVAEGVETQGQFNYLRAQSCDEMQGHFFGEAVPAADFELLLRNHKRMHLPTPLPADQPVLLIVDDEQGIRAALTRMLRPDGYRILCAANGQEGLDLLALNPIQVIISDQRMPGMSGTEFLSRVKQMYPDTVRIILSGYTDLAAVTDAVNRGSVFKFLTKPWDDDLLREQVRDAFRRHRPERPLP